MSLTATPAPLLPRATPASAQPPGCAGTITLSSGTYRIIVYLEDASGAKTHLSAHFDPQGLDKIRTLTQGLLTAHEKNSSSPLIVKGLSALGVQKADNTVASHDFLIHPISPVVAEQMSSSLATYYGTQVPAPALKAQDLWNGIETTVRLGMAAANPSQSLQLNTPPTAQPAAGQTPPPNANPSTPTPSPQLEPSAPPAHLLPPTTQRLTSIELDLNEQSLNTFEDYEALSDRLKFRLVREIYIIRCPRGGVYDQVWKHFERRRSENPAAKKGGVLDLLEEELSRLRCRLRNKNSAISPAIREQAEKVYEDCMNAPAESRPDFELKKLIDELMVQEFNCKEQLFERIRQHAEAEGVIIQEQDKQWAQHHFREDPRRFAHAVARWLDNDCDL